MIVQWYLHDLSRVNIGIHPTLIVKKPILRVITATTTAHTVLYTAIHRPVSITFTRKIREYLKVLTFIVEHTYCSYGKSEPGLILLRQLLAPDRASKHPPRYSDILTANSAQPFASRDQSIGHPALQLSFHIFYCTAQKAPYLLSISDKNP